MKLTIYYCDTHDHTVICLDDKEVCSNDYSVENVIRLGKYLDWKVELITLDQYAFEEKFA